MGRKLLLLIPVLILAAWLVLRSKQSPASPTLATVNLVGAPEFRALISDPEVFVLDVHTPEQEHLPGTDAVIPDTEVASRLGELPADKNTRVAVYCRSGNMSSRVAKLLIEKGYTNVTDLEGGTKAYK